MNKIKNQLLKIDENIENLNYESVYENLFFYDYHSKYLKKLQKSNIDKEDPHFVSSYSSFIGEVYENIIYELLVRYAVNNEQIKYFVLKGPHQDRYKNHKNGLMIDINSQIVYKAGYKDVTEFDGLFFTKDCVYFVESTIVKATTGLRKRLKKKKALLEILFPEKTVKSLIVLTKGAMGTSVFPDYCTVWLTNELNDEKLMEELIHKKEKPLHGFKKQKHEKLIHCEKIKLKNFKYFETLLWILKKLNENDSLNTEFLKQNQTVKYLDIYSKFYIGYLVSKEFLKLLKYLNITTISEDIPIESIFEDKIVVTIEQNGKNEYVLVYYLKVINGDLKRLDLNGSKLDVSKKDPKGFTSSEVKFLRYVFKHKYKISFEQVKAMIETLKS